MRFLGKAKIAEFIRSQSDPGIAEILRAWSLEVVYRTWDGPAALKNDFKGADVSRPPDVVFWLRSAPVRIDAIVDFRNRTVLLTSVQMVIQKAASQSSQYGHA